MKHLEVVGEVDEQRQLHATLPEGAPAGLVRVLVSWPESANGANGAAASVETATKDEDTKNDDVIASDWDSLMRLIEECQMDTGIEDLAHQHDHYLYGTPKRKE